jgi:DUF438 domain-containing protein
MSKECNKSKTQALVRILKRIDQGEDLRVVACEAGAIAGDIGLGEMTAAQQCLQESGYPEVVIGQLMAAFVLAGVYEQKRCRTRNQASDPDIVQVIAAEHGMFRSLAAELERILAGILVLESVSDTSLEFCRLAHAVHHLQAMNEHFDREEDVILPYLQRQGWAALCGMAAKDHAQLRSHINNLAELIASLGEFTTDEFKSHLVAEVSGLCSCLYENLSFEDGLLWPIALVVIADPATWSTITCLCDEIGYCGIHA